MLISNFPTAHCQLKNIYMKNLIIITTIAFMAFAPTQKKIKVWLVGDSTMSHKEVKAYPETGWGMPFKYFFDSTVVVDNRAMNGRSTRTFIEEKRWQAVVDDLSEGDYVFIQFGHNDESKEKTDRYTSPEDYKKNLLKFISEARSKKAIPVLLTPVSRRRFDKDGNILQTHEEYSPLVREVAKTQKVLFIDLDEKSRKLLQEFGVENSKLLFNQLQPGEHPNYPDGKEDNTHFNELGARKVAELVLEDIKTQQFGLAERIVKGTRK